MKWKSVKVGHGGTRIRTWKKIHNGSRGKLLVRCTVMITNLKTTVLACVGQGKPYHIIHLRHYPSTNFSSSTKGHRVPVPVPVRDRGKGNPHSLRLASFPALFTGVTIDIIRSSVIRTNKPHLLFEQTRGINVSLSASIPCIRPV